MSAATLVFPHHLFAEHPGIAPDRKVILIEDTLFFDDPHVRHGFHAKKRILHRASMQAYAHSLESKGHDVQYIEWRPGSDPKAMLDQALQGASEIHTASFDDYLLEKRVRRWAEKGQIALHVSDSPMFLTNRADADKLLAGKKNPIMADFYRQQRRNLGILVDGSGRPKGGKWSFDTENRKKLPKGAAVPAPWQPQSSKWVDDASKWHSQTFDDSFGMPNGFSYPVTHEQARSSFDHFLKHRLHSFGDYEDAIDPRHGVLFHSVLTPALNIGLITPREVIRATLDHADSHDVPMNSLEGFLRQIIGWREFMREMYHRRGTAVRKSNFWRFDRRMPAAFYNGETGIPPVDQCIRRALETGYCHHIERLMVLGGFMLVCRIHPDDVYRWFMELFVDAYDWVMVPNVYAMSQFADGGTFTTKPYLSGSNYILKMSGWPKGPWCAVWDALYWAFVADHSEVFLANPRMAMMARMVSRMPAAKLDAHRRVAGNFLERLDNGSVPALA